MLQKLSRFFVPKRLIVVLVLLAVINVREARQERKLAAEQRR